MRFHKAHLTRRLILDTSADSEKEENMVEWYSLLSNTLYLCIKIIFFTCMFI